jgi:phospholipase/carboxylesterase
MQDMDKKEEHMCKELVAALKCVEQYQRFIFTPQMAKPLEQLGKVKNRLQEMLRDLYPVTDSKPMDTLHETLRHATEQMIQVLELLTKPSDNNFQNLIMQVMRAFRINCRVLENLFPFHVWLSPLNQYLTEPGVTLPDKTIMGEIESSDTGLFHVGVETDRYNRGSVSFYIPDTITRDEKTPLIIALHGGLGHGRDFIWTWLREARTKKYILMAPTSMGNTWSLMNPKEDIDHIQTALEHIKKRWSIDSDRILLTGISDGATFALTTCVRENVPFSAYAIVAGTLPPGDLTRAKEKRIYWVHGALDWMFPISQARMFTNLLLQSGADIIFREIPDLSHTYPREENLRIVDWFESG